MCCTTSASLIPCVDEERVERGQEPAGLPVLIERQRIEHGVETIEHEIVDRVRPEPFCPLRADVAIEQIETRHASAQRHGHDGIIAPDLLCAEPLVEEWRCHLGIDKGDAARDRRDGVAAQPVVPVGRCAGRVPDERGLARLELSGGEATRARRLPVADAPAHRWSRQEEPVAECLKRRHVYRAAIFRIESTTCFSNDPLSVEFDADTHLLCRCMLGCASRVRVWVWGQVVLAAIASADGTARPIRAR